MNTATKVTDEIFQSIRDHVYTDLLDHGFDNATAYLMAFGGGSILQFDEVLDFVDSPTSD